MGRGDVSLTNGRVLIVTKSGTALVQDMLLKGVFFRPEHVENVGYLYKTGVPHYFLLVSQYDSVPAFIASLSLLKTHLRDRMRYAGVFFHLATEAISKKDVREDFPFIAQISSFSMWEGSGRLKLAHTPDPLQFPDIDLKSISNRECVSGFKKYKALSWAFLSDVEVYDNISAFFADACATLGIPFSVVCLCLSSIESNIQRKGLPALLSRYFSVTV